MKATYAGKCTCGHTTTHTRPRRLSGDWANGYEGECTGRTGTGETCGKDVFLRCVEPDDVSQAA